MKPAERAKQTNEILDGKIAEFDKQIADALLAKHNLTLDGNKVRDADGTEAYVWLEWKKERQSTHSSFYMGALNGKLRLYIGNWGDKTHFRMKKDGTMRIDDIADELELRFRRDLAIKRRESDAASKRKTNEALVERIARVKNISKYGTGLEVSWKTGSMKFEIGGLNDEQADAFVSLAIELGLIKQND